MQNKGEAIKCVRCMDGSLEAHQWEGCALGQTFLLLIVTCNSHTHIRATETVNQDLKGLFWEGSFEGQVKANWELFPPRKSNGTLRENSLNWN